MFTEYVDERYGVIIDIGSGSVLVSIVHSVPGEASAQVVWSERVISKIRQIDNLNESIEVIITTLRRVTTLLDTRGRRALLAYDSNARISHLQCGIAAPWSYTVTRKVEYKQEKPFVVTNKLLKQLQTTALEKILADARANGPLRQAGLQLITWATTDLCANQYRIDHQIKPLGKSVSELSLTCIAVVAPRSLVLALRDISDKLLPDMKIRNLSFMLILSTMLRELSPSYHDVSVLDITYEATELGNIQNGVLTETTHIPYGVYSLVREISACTKLPLVTVFGHLSSAAPFYFLESLNKKQQKEVGVICEAYVSQITELLYGSKDTLSRPTQVVVHVESCYEPLFKELITGATNNVPSVTTGVAMITKEITKQLQNKQGGGPEDDTALLLSAQFFHMHGDSDDFEYL